MATQTSIALTRRLTVESGAHILYFYSNHHAYIENALQFIQAGMTHGQPVIFIDSLSHWREIRTHLLNETPDSLKDVYYIDNADFYGIGGDFQYHEVLQNLKDAVDPFVKSQTKARLWGHVDWVDDPNILEKVHQYEYSCDITVSEIDLLTVCAYDANRVPASIQIEMMRTHSYWLTDRELVRSSLYHRYNSQLQHVFPSISNQQHLESERDLYKHKLDFVHVVSHEVRNPLTVIQAYASMLSQSETDPARAEKLQTIVDYAMVINHEISHIIETEQMLSTEALWRKSIVSPRAILDDVLHVMETKARTQNIRLQSAIEIPYLQTFFSSKISLKLIFSNIISNAIKYSHEGSNVEVAVRVADGWLECEVQDYGVGMSPDQMPMLFRKYEKSNDNASGQGIGLFMVKNLVDELQGEILFDSAVNEGTRVKIRLPLM